jgi:hypothetical protein
MRRDAAGRFEITSTAGEAVRAFVLAPLPPDPPLALLLPAALAHVPFVFIHPRDYPDHSAADQPKEAGSFRNPCNREFPADSARPCGACWVIKSTHFWMATAAWAGCCC